MRFLTVEDAVELHVLQLERFGGGAGIRSLPLLESAAAQPEASLATADDRLYELAMNVAAGSADKAAAAALLRVLAGAATAP